MEFIVRVNSFVTKSSGTWGGGSDKDLDKTSQRGSKKFYEIGKDYELNTLFQLR